MNWKYTHDRGSQYNRRHAFFYGVLPWLTLALFAIVLAVLADDLLVLIVKLSAVV